LEWLASPTAQDVARWTGFVTLSATAGESSEEAQGKP